MSWRKSPAVAEWDWRHEVWPAYRHMTLLFWKWGFLLGTPIVFALAIWSPPAIIPILVGWGFICVLVPVGFTLQFWLFAKAGTACGVYKRGLGTSFGYGSSICRWEEIASYRFEDFSEIPETRCLYVARMHKGQKTKFQLLFSPQEVNEEKIEQLIQSHHRPAHYDQSQISPP